MLSRRHLLRVLSGLVVGAAASCGEGENASANAVSRPAEILILRHGEEDKRAPDEHLGPRGRARAEALPKLFPVRFVTPTFLFASRSTMQTHREVETLQPLAAALHLPIDDSIANENYRKLATLLLTRPAHAGAHILVCWHHGDIPELASALGVARPPSSWPDGQYDHVWQLQYDAKRVTLTDHHLRLLPGDGL